MRRPRPGFRSRPGRRARGWAPASALSALLLFAACEQVSVTAAVVEQIDVLPPVASVRVGEVTTLAALLKGRGGTALSGRVVAWTSLDPAIAEVDAAGAVRGLAPGTARIRASAEGASSQAVVSVTPRDPMLSVSPDTLTFASLEGGPDPAVRTVAVSEVWGTPLGGLSAEVAYPVGQDAGWLAVTFSDTATPATMTVRATTGSLAAGTYHATIRVSAPAAANGPQPVAVRFVVQAPSSRSAPAALRARDRVRRAP